MKDAETVNNISQKFISLLFAEKDLEGVLNLCADDVILFSNLSSEAVSGKEELADLVLFHRQSLKADFAPELLGICVHFLGTDAASSFLSYYLTENVYLQATVTCRKSAGEWLVSQVSFYYDLKSECQKDENAVLRYGHKAMGLQKALSSNKWVIGSFSLQKKDDFLFLYADKKFLSFLGFEKFSFFREKYPDFKTLLKGDNAEHVFADFKEQAVNVGDILLECCLEKESGETVWAGLVGSAFFDAGGELAVNFLVFDIHHQKNELEQLKTLLQSLTGGFAIYYVDSSFSVIPQYYSSGLYKFFHLSKEEFWEKKQKDFFSLIHEEDRAAVMEAFNNAIHSNAPLTMEFRSGLHAKSSWLKSYSFIHENKDGTKLLYVAFADISAQRNLSGRLQMICDNLHGAIIRCEYDTWTVLETNKFFYKECEFDEEYFRQNCESNFLKLICEEKRDELVQLVKSKNVGEGFEYPASLCLSGKKKHILLTGEVFEECEHKFIDLLLTDTTAIKNKQALLKEKSKELALICNSVPSLVFRCQCNEKGTITFANHAFYEYLGYNKVSFAQEFRNEFSRILAHDASKSIWNSLIASLTSQSHNVFTFECTVRNRQGEEKILYVKARRMYSKDNEPFFYCIADDRTEIYRNEQGLEFAKIKLQTAITHLNILYWEYNPQTDQGTIYFFGEGSQDVFQVDNFVDFVLKSGRINQEFHSVFRSLHEQLRQGALYVEANLPMKFETSEMWRKIRYSNMFDAEGRPVLSIGTSEDINAYMTLKKRLISASNQTGVTVWTYNPATHELGLESEAEFRFFMGNKEQNVPWSHIEAKRVFEEDTAVYLDFYEQIFQGKESASCDIRFYNFQTADYSWLRLKYALVDSGDSSQPKVLGTALDITEQKRAEKLYNEQIQLWQLAQADMYGSLSYNVNTREVLFSRLGNIEGIAVQNIDAELERFKNYILTEGQKEEFVRFFDRESIVRKFEQGMPQGFCLFQSRFFNKPVWLRCEFKVMKHYESGDLICLVSLHDITQQIIREKFADLCVLHQIDFTFQVDIKNDRYQMWNENRMLSDEALEKYTGIYSCDCPALLSYYAAEDDRERIIYEMSLPNLVARAKQHSNFEIGFRCVIRGRTDEIRYKRFHVFQYDEKTATICIGCVDITELYIEEQRKNDELYQALEATRQANKAKSSFLASMSHDLRTPMNAIIGMTNLALEDLNDMEQIRESLGIIKSSSAHLLNLLNDILDMAKIESGKTAVSNTVFSVTKSVAAVCDVFKVAAQQKNIRYSVRFENIQNDRVLSDETRFNRIISNIVSNAVKFTQENGEVQVVVEELKSVRSNIACFTVTVRDTGIGISEEQAELIFTPFHRVESSMISKIEGSGLGLAIVKALTDSLGGTVSVASRLGEGSTFAVKLQFLKDLGAADQIEIRQEETVRHDFDGLSALLVEDHPINITVIKKLLEKTGMKVVVCHDGKEGVETFLQSDPSDFDVIFMDLQMPVMDGYEASECIRKSAHPKAKRIPIIALSANTFEEDIKKCFEAGMTAHVAKPVSMQKLKEVISDFVLHS